MPSRSSKFVRQAAQLHTRNLAGRAAAAIAEALYGGLAEAMYRNRQGVFSEDSGVAQEAAHSALESLEDDISRQFVAVLGQASSRALTRGSSPVAAGAPGSRALNSAFSAALSAYRSNMSFRAVAKKTAKRHRHWLQYSTGSRFPHPQWKTTRAYKKRTPNNPPLHRHGRGNFGVQSGTFARSFLAEHQGGSLRGAVRLSPAGSSAGKRVLVRRVVNAGQSHAGITALSRRELLAELGPSLREGEVLDAKLSAETQMRMPDDIGSRVMWQRLRRNNYLPYNSRSLAAAALEQAILRAFPRS